MPEAQKNMKEEISYYVVRKKAVPEVLLKVVEAKRLLDSESHDRTGGNRAGGHKQKFVL